MLIRLERRPAGSTIRALIPLLRLAAAEAFAAAMVAVIGLFGLQVFGEFPSFGVPVMDRLADTPASTYLQDGLAQTGAPNIVTAVLLDYRAWDTLGEATVLFCAALGAAAILRRKARISGKRGDAEGSKEEIS